MPGKNNSSLLINLYGQTQHLPAQRGKFARRAQNSPDAQITLAALQAKSVLWAPESLKRNPVPFLPLAFRLLESAQEGRGSVALHNGNPIRWL